MSKMNQLGNCKNPFQGNYKKVLCVCSAGLLRSPTTAVVLSQDPYNYNTRAAGLTEEYALIPVNDVLLTWADEIVCMESWQASTLNDMLNDLKLDTNIVCLGIQDSFAYRDIDLMKNIGIEYDKAIKVLDEK